MGQPEKPNLVLDADAIETAGADHAGAEVIDITPFLKRALSISKSELSPQEKKDQLAELEATNGPAGDAFREWLKRVRAMHAKLTRKRWLMIAGAMVVAAGGVVATVRFPALRKGAMQLATAMAKPRVLSELAVKKISEGAKVGLALGGGSAVSMTMTKELALEMCKQRLL